MVSVRLKLAALVLGCMVPAFAAATVHGLAARKRLLAQSAAVIDGAHDRLNRILDDTLKGRRAPLVMASNDAELKRHLASGDGAAVAGYLKPLKQTYRHRVIMLSDATGKLLAAGNADRGPISLGAEGSPAFVGLLQGKPVDGLIKVATPSGPGHAIGAAAPILDADGHVAGAFAVLSPLSDNYLSYLGRRVQVALSLSVNGQHVAATRDHAAPKLHAPGEAATFEERADRLWAVKSFRPPALQRPGQVVELTASQDVSALRDRSRASLLAELAVLAAIALLVLVLALVFATRLARTVSGISSAAAEVKQGNYVTAPLRKSRDELESLTVDFNAMVDGLKERDHIKETFGRYVTRQVADHVMHGKQELGGELVPVTVLFSDIRSFTSISEQMEPRALLDFLNTYFSGMVESVLNHRGVVDKFIGDAIMAVFGAPVPEPEDALRAVKAALEMQASLVRINKDFKARGLPEVRSGIGLHSGQVVAGNMGHSERMEYTVIGDTVNLASRLEGMTKELGCDVVISEDLYSQVAQSVEAEPLREIHVKGRKRPVMVYRLIGLKPA